MLFSNTGHCLFGFASFSMEIAKKFLPVPIGDNGIYVLMGSLSVRIGNVFLKGI